MRRSHVPWTIAVLAVFASFGWVYAQGGRSSGALTAQDYADIHQLYSRYNQGTDFGNAEMWLDVFIEDATFRPYANQDRRRGASATEFVGREEMAEWRAGVFARRQPDYQYRHWNSSWVITPTGDGGAEGRVYWLAFDPSAEELAISDTGYYEDLYVKTADGWRIKERTAYSDLQPEN